MREVLAMTSIFERVSVRKFAEKSVESAKTEYILKAAMQAPSAGNQQPWDFYVVTRGDLLADLGKVGPYAGPVANAPIAIVVTTRKNCRFKELALVDSALAMQNIWLATSEVGLGGVWLAVAPYEDRMKDVAVLLNLPCDVQPFAIFAYGYSLENRKQQNRFDISRIHYL